MRGITALVLSLGFCALCAAQQCPQPTTISSGTQPNQIPYLILAAGGIGSGGQRSVLVGEFNKQAAELAKQYCQKVPGCVATYSPATSANIQFSTRDFGGWTELTIRAIATTPGAGNPPPQPQVLGPHVVKRAGVIVPPSPNVECEPEPLAVKKAQDFWKDFDDHTLRGVGKHIRDIYGKDRAQKFVDDMNAVLEALQGCLDSERKQAHGQTPSGEDKRNQATRVKKLVDSGALARMSRLQLDIMRDHFPDGNQADFARLQLAFEMFANGELRTGNPGAREMDQMGQWFLWKCFANIAIENNVDKAAWEKLIHSLEKAKEIYRRVYPAKPGAKSKKPMGELANGEGSESRASRFDKSKQLTEAEKKKLREEIDKLTVAQVLQRERAELAAMTVASANPCPRRAEFAQVRQQPHGESVSLLVTVRISGSETGPVEIPGVWLHASENGFAVPDGSFLQDTNMDIDGSGAYTTTLLVSAKTLGLNLSAWDNQCQAFVTKSITISAPAD